MHRDSTLSPQMYCQARDSQGHGEKGREVGENQSRLCSLFLLPGLHFPTELQRGYNSCLYYSSALLYSSFLQPSDPRHSGQRELNTTSQSSQPLLGARGRGGDRTHAHRLPNLPEKKQRISILWVLGTPHPTMPQPRMLKFPLRHSGGSALTMQMSCLTRKCLSWAGDPPFESHPSARVLHPHLLTISCPWMLDSLSVGGRWGRAGRDPAQSSGGFWGLGAWA